MKLWERLEMRFWCCALLWVEICALVLSVSHAAINTCTSNNQLKGGNAELSDAELSGFWNTTGEEALFSTTIYGGLWPTTQWTLSQWSVSLCSIPTIPGERVFVLHYNDSKTPARFYRHFALPPSVKAAQMRCVCVCVCVCAACKYNRQVC